MKTQSVLTHILATTACTAVLLLSACAAPDGQAPSSGSTASNSAGTEVTGTRLKVKDKDQINVQTGSDVQSSGARGN